MNTAPQVQWSSRGAFLLAACGAAVGIGSIWRFPYLTGAYGGSAFVALYIIAVGMVVLPVLMAEILIGRRARCGPPEAVAIVTRMESASKVWHVLGWQMIATGFFILSFFSVVSGWIIDYLGMAAVNAFASISAESARQLFADMLASPLRLLATHSLFIVLLVGIVGCGVRDGIERTSKIMMPMLFVLLLVLAGYSLVSGAARPALHFLFQFNYHQITAQVIVLAIGQAFLSVGVCSGMMVIYGAYVPDEVSIPATSLVIVGSVIGVSILSGLVIFPLVFAYGLQPDQGAGLIFEMLPVAFGRMPFGHAFGAAFFLLLLFASATSSVALLEQVTAWLERRFVLGRWTASIAAGAAAWCVGVGSVLSFNVLKDVRPLHFIPAFANDGIFEIMDFVTTTLMLLAGGVALAVFAGWRIGSATARGELRFDEAWQHTLWRFLLRYVVPIALVLVLLLRAGG